MVKVLSVKVTDEVYKKIDNQPDNHSDFLRQTIKEYFERHNIKLKKHE